MFYYHYIKTNIPYIPEILAIANPRGICDIIFNNQKEFNIIPLEYSHENIDIFIKLKQEIDLYATGQLKIFTIPIDMQGTTHQRKIWQLLLKIPYGTTQSYKDIALQAESSPRAVGGANKKNRLPIIIPCHRVIHHDGKIGGYFGTTLDYNFSMVNLKQSLLACEMHFNRIKS